MIKRDQPIVRTAGLGRQALLRLGAGFGAAIAGMRPFSTAVAAVSPRWQRTPRSCTTIRVAPDGTADFLSPALAVAAITDSAPERRYIVLIEPGTYTETEWIVPSYVTLRGADRDTCILAGALPNDATDAQISLTSTLWLRGTAALENLTILATNMRYAVHSEQSGANRDAVHTIRNCHIEHVGNEGARQWRRDHSESGMSPATVWSSDRPWGYGSASGVIEEFADCTFVGPKEPWYIHTNKDFSSPTLNSLSRCTFVQTGPLTLPTLTIQSMGSGQRDVVSIEDSTFNGLFVRHDDRPWITERPELQVADHAEIGLTMARCSPLGYRPNLGGLALRITATATAADLPITVGGSAGSQFFGTAVARAGGGGVPSYVYGQWDVSGILVGLRSDLIVDNTLGRRLGDCSMNPKELVVTVGTHPPVAIEFTTDCTTATNDAVLAVINAELAPIANASVYDVGLHETYPTFPDRESVETNTGTLGIPRFAAVAPASGGIQRLAAAATACGVALEQFAPGRSGRVLAAGILWNKQLPGLDATTIRAGATVFYSDTDPGTFTLSGTRQFGVATAENWVSFDLR